MPRAAASLTQVPTQQGLGQGRVSLLEQRQLVWVGQQHLLQQGRVIQPRQRRAGARGPRGRGRGRRWSGWQQGWELGRRWRLLLLWGWLVLLLLLPWGSALTTRRGGARDRDGAKVDVGQT